MTKLRTFLFALAMMAMPSAVAAAASPPDTAAPPAKPATANVAVSENEIQTLEVALKLSAAMCGENPTGCAVGLNAPQLFTKLEAARAELQGKPK